MLLSEEEHGSGILWFLNFGLPLGAKAIDPANDNDNAIAANDN